MFRTNSIVLCFVIFCVVYGPLIDSSFGAFFDISFLICVFIVVLHVANNGGLGLDKFTYVLCVFIVFIFFIALTSAIFLDVENIEHSTRAIMRPIRVLPTILGVSILARYIVNNGIEREVIDLGLKLVFLVVLIHAVLMISQFFNEELRNYVYQFTTAKYVVQNYQATRIAGLAGAGGAQLSIAQSFGLILGVYLFVTAGSLKFKLFVFLSCQFILASIFLSGRSGLLTAFFFCPIYFLYLNFLGAGGKAIKNFLFAFAGVALSLSLLFYLLFDILAENPMFMSVFNRIFDTFIGYGEGQGLKVNTLTVLSNMFILPDDAMHLIFGKASYLNNNTLYGILTDIGYFRLVWGYGLLGSIFHYGFYIFSIYTILKLRNVSIVHKSLPLMFLFLTLFFNSKEILIFTKHTFQICMFAVFLVYFTNNKMNNMSMVIRRQYVN